MIASPERRRGARRWFFGAGVLLLLALALTAGRFYVSAVASSTFVTVRLKELDESGVSGRAKLEAANGATWVRISITGPDQEYLPYLHSGTCAEYRRAQAIPLSIVTPDEPGETAIDVSLEELQSGDYVISLHAAVADIETLFDPGSSVACGVVGKKAGPARAGEPTGEVQPPFAGVGPIEDRSDWMMVAASALGAASFALAVAGVREHRYVAEGFTTIDVVRIRRLQGLTR